MEFRLLQPGDYDDIVRVWTESGLRYKPKGRDSKAEFSRQMALDPEMFLGCFIQYEMVGVIVGSYDSRKGYINRLAVVPGHRKKGIAGNLIAKMEDYLRKKGYRIITLLIEDASFESAGLFSKMGYARHEDIKYYTKRESDDI